MNAINDYGKFAAISMEKQNAWKVPAPADPKTVGKMLRHPGKVAIDIQSSATFEMKSNCLQPFQFTTFTYINLRISKHIKSANLMRSQPFSCSFILKATLTPWRLAPTWPLNPGGNSTAPCDDLLQSKQIAPLSAGKYTKPVMHSHAISGPPVTSHALSSTTSTCQRWLVNGSDESN